MIAELQHCNSVGHFYNSFKCNCSFKKSNWLECHRYHYLLFKKQFTNTLLLGDSNIAGLSRYLKVWQRHFTPFKALNWEIGGERAGNVLWRPWVFQYLHLSKMWLRSVEPTTFSRVLIKDVVIILEYLYLKHDFSFTDQNNGWALPNADLGPSLLFRDYLHLIEEGNVKHAKLIINSIALTNNIYFSSNTGKRYSYSDLLKVKLQFLLL